MSASATASARTDESDIAPNALSVLNSVFGLPGFRAGWFRLRTNEKALVLLTDPFGVTYLPTREGYALLISTTALLGALGAAAATPAQVPAPS